MSDFTKLTIWQKAHNLTISIYKLTSKLPAEERLGLASQLRRAAVSVESNIAEGESKYSTKDKLNFFIQSRSSAAEIQTQLLIVSDIYKQLSKESIMLKSEYEILGKQINKLISFRRGKNE